jgi:hypothetical protein
MELKDIDGSRFLYDPKSPDIVTILQDKIPEFQKYSGKIPAKKVFQYIVLMYDVNSPLWRDVLDYYVRKSTVADMVGFPKKKNTWSEESESILIGTDDIVNGMIVAFVAQFNGIEFYQMIAYLSLLSSETKKAVSYDGDKNSISIITQTGDKIKELQRVVFRSGEYDEIAQVRKALYSRLEKERLKIRPEDVVRQLAEDGCLPEDFNPYGQNYTPEKSKFIGDEVPMRVL